MLSADIQGVYTVAEHRQPVVVGTALEYRPGLFLGPIRYNAMGWVRGQIGWTSVPDCAHLGDLVDARVGNERGLWRVTDCTRAKDLARLKHWKPLPVVMEVDYATARRGGWDVYRLGKSGKSTAVIYRYIKTGWSPPPWHWLYKEAK
jgi:hypothetical protein